LQQSTRREVLSTLKPKRIDTSVPDREIDIMPEAREWSALDRNLSGLFAIADLYDRHPNLDQDKNGKIKRTEVYAALPSQEYKGDDAVALATFRMHFKDITGFADEGEKRDVTRDDLKEMARFSRLKGMKMIAEGAEIYRTLDRNGDGKLTREELKEQIAACKDGSASKKAVEAMLKDFEIIGGKNARFITRDQIKEYVARRLSPQQEQRLDSIARTFQERRARLQGANENLFSDSTPSRSVKGEAIKQGKVGDCWLISACSSFFEKNPAAVDKFFKENKDGTVTVTFPYKYKGENLKATIAKPSQAELALYATTGKYGTYGAMAEKALGEIFKQHPELKGELTGVERNRGNGAPVQEFLEASRKPFALELLTGEKAKTVDLRSLSKEQIHHILSLSANAVSTCDSDGHWPKVAGRQPVADKGAAKGASGAGSNASSDNPSQREHPKTPPEDSPLLSGIGDVSDRPIDRPEHIPQPFPQLVPKPWDVDEDEEEAGDKKADAHEFAILHYDEKNKMVTVRNPWGFGELTDEHGQPLDGKDDGVMRLTLDQFVKYFHHMSLPERVIERGLLAEKQARGK